MKLDKTALLELHDYIEQLNDNNLLKDSTYEDITNVIDREIGKLNELEKKAK